MIDFDAATVLLQWATGGSFFLWITTRRREVGLGYGWLMRGVYGVMALGAVLAGFRWTSILGRDIASVVVTALVALGLALSILQRRAGVSGYLEEHEAFSVANLILAGIWSLLLLGSSAWSSLAPMRAVTICSRWRVP
jgi:hypothetical protein